MQEFTVTNLDRVGELIFENGKLLRKINPQYYDHIINLFENGFISELIKKNLFVESILIKEGKTTLGRT